MSTAPSSVPPPSFGLAPELPDGVERPPPPQAPIWKPWMAWVALVAAFGGALIGALIVGVIGAAAGASFSDPTPAVSISATIVQDLSFIGAALFFARIAGAPAPEQFGLRPTRLWPAVGWMALAYAGFYAFTAAGWRSWAPSRSTIEASQRARRRQEHVGAGRRWRCWSPSSRRCGGVLLPRLLLRRAAQLERAGGRASPPGWSSGRSTPARPSGSSCCPWPSSAPRCAWLRERTGSLYPGHRVALRQQLARLRGVAALGLADRRPARVRAGVFWLVAILIRAAGTPRRRPRRSDAPHPAVGRGHSYMPAP